MSNSEFALAESVSTTNASYFIFIYILILVYCCVGLAVVCDVYFVPALQKLSYTYDLPPDIAGSTLMALGASVPELFASLIGVFVTEDDIGTGSIIGSSCFNLIAVPAACAFVASASFSTKLKISPIPVLRNSAFYAITILVLLLVIKDNKVDIPEALILLLFFVMYMAFMIICAQASGNSETGGAQTLSLTDSSYTSADSAIAECNKLNHDKTLSGRSSASALGHQVYGQFYIANSKQDVAAYNGIGANSPQLVATEKTPLVASNKTKANAKSCQVFISAPVLSSEATRNEFADSVSINLGFAIKNSTCLVKEIDSCEQLVDKHEQTCLNSNWILLPMLPLTLSLRLLTPLKFKNTCWTIWTFLVSIALIGALTYVSVWMVHMIGQSLGIPETVAGMTILSWGTGIPELIASIVLIKKTAQADMAICNTIGSNVIDASFCLGVPWLVKCLLNKADGSDAEVAIQSAALPWTSFTLFVSVLMLIVVLKLHNWELSFSVGVWLALTYAAFVCVATYLESSFSQSGLDLLALLD